MISITLIPNIHPNTEVNRLSLHMFDAGEEENAEQEDEQEEQDEQHSHDTFARNGTIQAWTDLEVYKLIEYKVLGMTALAIAERMGRSVSSITKKWHQATTEPNSEWKDVIKNKFRAKMNDEGQEAAVKAKEQTKRRKGGETASTAATSGPQTVSVSCLPYSWRAVCGAFTVNT